MFSIMDFTFGYTEIILSTIFLLFLDSFFRSKRRLPWEWPILGMMPMFVLHYHRLHDKLSEILEQNGGTFVLKGVWFTDTDKLFTSDPENAHYVLSKNFSNYEKGEEAKKCFDVFGDVLFNADHDEWQKDRRMVRGFFNDRRCIQATKKLVQDGLENGLIPVLEYVCEKGMFVDLQDLLTRLMLDSTCTLATGYNPGSLCIGFPDTPLATAMDIANDRIFSRHFTPSFLWKSQRFLGLGVEKKMSNAIKTIDDIAAKFISMKQEDIKGNIEGFDALKFFMSGDEGIGFKAQPYNVLRDIVVILNAGGRDTTACCLTWLLWLLAKNPLAESKIREELKSTLPKDETEKFRLFTIEELNKLPYLQAVFCETMRLYPPIPYQQRLCVQTDTLPSGHQVHPKMEIMFSWYALGRMKSIWGDDALEFKPERWISEKGEIKNDLVNKFLFSFSSGPRVCPGKNDAYTRMKVIASAIVHNYDIKLLEEHRSSLNVAIILGMKNGLKVKITKRWN